MATLRYGISILEKFIGQQVSIIISRSTNRNLTLMDSGNLVLRDEQYVMTLWESFQNPADTFLPGMKMDEELTLSSWIGDGDPGTGNFTFKQDREGEERYAFRVVGWMNEKCLMHISFVFFVFKKLSLIQSGTVP